MNSNSRWVRRSLMLGTVLSLSGAMTPAAFAQQAAAEPTVGPQSDREQARVDAGATQAPAGENVGIQDIVVTARRSNESAQRVPIAISTVTSADLTRLSVRDIKDIQALTPGFQIASQNTAGRAKLTIRGQSEVDSRLTTDPSVGVYIDDVSLSRSYGLRSSLVDIERIEVLKGPQGTLYGRNTTGGAVNITTKHPTYDFGGYFDFLYGSYDYTQATGVLNLPIVDNRVALRVVGQAISREGYGRLSDGEQINDDHVYSGRALLRIDPADNVRVLLSADYVRQRNKGTNIILTSDLMLQNANAANRALGEIARELGLDPTIAANRLTAYNAWRTYYDAFRNGKFYDGFANAPGTEKPRDDLDHYGFSGKIDVDVGPVTLTSISSYRNLRKAYAQNTDGVPFVITGGFLSTDQEIFTQELRASAIDGEGFDWQGGLFYSRETGNELSTNDGNAFITPTRSRLTDIDVRNTSKAAYFQGIYDFGSNVRLTGGIRYTKDNRFINSMNRTEPSLATPVVPGQVLSAPTCNLLAPSLGGPTYPNCSYKTSTKSDKVTWLVSADWRPIDQLMLYASVSTGYRSGGFTYNGTSAPTTSLPAFLAAYEPFRPESVTNYEIGFKSDLLDRRLRVNLSVFYQDYSDIQQRIRDQVNGALVTLVRNAASAKIKGGELEITAVPTDGLTLNFGAAYLDAKYDEFIARDASGNLLDLTNQAFSAPDWTFNIGGTYEIPTSNGYVRLSANYNWTDDVDYQPGTTVPAGTTQPAFGLLDGRISWFIEPWDLDIAVFGKNLTNKHYWNNATNGETLGFNLAFPGEPRRFGVQIKKTF
ncbi:TonB-dependent receptor [Sphingobium fuliginis]|uniref:TonB-dependent receptor n=1 Tax=Sphingobium fuliginis ATCC 27551 TaxID=1208342 RepID=A0A5B8CEF4_SPHSA|nr:TonB-dependent receptor [Sphingobium fuliginis]QDC37265.1 TonB-dependent receptor [Sphingobium fuliginis ATCC 27551]